MVGEERNSAGAYQSRARSRADPATSSMESRPRTGWRSDRRARCGTRSSPPGRWRTRPIPELGDSAIHKLIDALATSATSRCRWIDLLGPSTLNIGTLSGGRAPNVIADEAHADIMVRLVGDSSETKAALAQRRGRPRRIARSDRNSRAAAETARWNRNHRGRLHHRHSGFRRELGRAVSHRTGTIHVAHTLEERVPKQQLTEAVEIYQRMVKHLCKRESK